MALMDSPAYGRARAATEKRWRELAGSSPTEEGWDRFQTLIDECAFANLLKALNGDPNFPRVVRIVMPPHDWFGMSVPGSRFGAALAQTRATRSFRWITAGDIESMVAGSARRRLTTITRCPPTPTSRTRSPRSTITISVVDDDARFTLTVGPEAAAQESHPDQARRAVPFHPLAVAPTGARRRPR